MLEFPPLETWQFYSACRAILGAAHLQKLFKRSQTEIYRWGADPDTCSETSRNPLDRHEHLLRRLVELGREDIARAMVARQARIIGCVLEDEGDCQPDQDTAIGEILDDVPALAEFHDACRRYLEGEGSSSEVQHTCEEACRELKETRVEVLANRLAVV